MAQIISINIGGKNIPVLESANSLLQQYIRQVSDYYNTDPLREDIVSETEFVLAQKLAALLNAGNPFITDAQMAAAIAETGAPETLKAAPGRHYQPGGFYNTAKKMYRDADNKKIAGVCAGIGHWLNMDPNIVRVLFVVITLSGFGSGILLYAAIWMFVPAKSLAGFTGRKLFRNPYDKMLGGVCSGIAAYFNKEVNLVRLLFAIPVILKILRIGTFNDHYVFINSLSAMVAGIYIILWIALPEPDNNRDRRDMFGPIPATPMPEPAITNTTMPLAPPEPAFTHNPVAAYGAQPVEKQRANTFFTVVMQVFRAVFLVFFGMVLLACLAAFFGVLFSVPSSYFTRYLWTSPYQRMMAWATLLLFAGTPLIAATVWMVRRLAGVKTPGNYLRWLFGILWTAGWVALVLFMASMSKDLNRREAETAPVASAQPANGLLVIKAGDPVLQFDNIYQWLNNGKKISGLDINADTLKINTVRLQFIKSNDSLFHINVEKSAAGVNTNDALARLRKINYMPAITDTVLNLPSGFAISSSDKYRLQSVKVIIAVPAGKKVMMDESINQKLQPWDINLKNAIDIKAQYRNQRDYKPGVIYTMSQGGNLNAEDGAAYGISTDADTTYRFNDGMPANAGAARDSVPGGDTVFRFNN